MSVSVNQRPLQSMTALPLHLRLLAPALTSILCLPIPASTPGAQPWHSLPTSPCGRAGGGAAAAWPLPWKPDGAQPGHRRQSWALAASQDTGSELNDLSLGPALPQLQPSCVL